jgi:hypothetical protein
MKSELNFLAFNLAVESRLTIRCQFDEYVVVDMDNGLN